jgi:hypothetical protein
MSRLVKIFLKMTSFSLLQFKFTQIFIMTQNVFKKGPKFLKKNGRISGFQIFLFLSRLNFITVKFFCFLSNFKKFDEFTTF